MKKLLLAILTVFICHNAFGAVASSSVIEVRSSGSDLNGGGFNPVRTQVFGGLPQYGTDYSQSDTPIWTTANLEAYGSGATLQVVATNFVTRAQIGNFLNIRTIGGGFIAGFYEVTAVYPPNTMVLDRNCTGTTRNRSISSTATCALGGGVKNLYHLQSSIAGSTNPIVAGNIVYIKSGNYIKYGASTAVLTPSVAGGNGTPVIWKGYKTVHDDIPTGSDRPQLRGDTNLAGSTDTTNVMTSAVAGQIFSNLIFANSIAVAANLAAISQSFNNCKFVGAGTAGFATANNSSKLFNCEASDSGTIGISQTGSGSGNLYINCYAHDNKTQGFNIVGDALCLNCVAVRNGGGGFWGSSVNFINCISGYNFGSASDGFQLNTANAIPVLFLNNISVGNGRYGLYKSLTTASQHAFNDYNLYFNNKTAAYQGWNSYGIGAPLTGSHNKLTNPYMDSFDAGGLSSATTKVLFLTGSPCINNGYNPVPSTGTVVNYNINMGVDQLDHITRNNASSN